MSSKKNEEDTELSLLKRIAVAVEYLAAAQLRSAIGSGHVEAPAEPTKESASE
jgi:hypothetical protein